MAPQVMETTSAVCQACGRAEERVRRRRRDAAYCSQGCRNYAYRRRKAATAALRAKAADFAASLIG
jgi:hypothetical protein